MLLLIFIFDLSLIMIDITQFTKQVHRIWFSLSFPILQRQSFLFLRFQLAVILKSYPSSMFQFFIFQFSYNQQRLFFIEKTQLQHMIENYARSRDKNKSETPKEHWEIEVRNLPQRIQKEDIVHFLWKSLESCQGLIRHGSPVIQYNLLENERALRLNFRSQQQAFNCLLLDHLYFGKKVLFITSRFLPVNRHKNLNTDKLKIVKSEVHDKFRQIYVCNLPHMNSMEILNYLSDIGELKSFVDETKDESSSSCYCQYINDELTEQALKKLNQSKLKGRSVIAKRATLMKTKQSSKTKIMSTTKNTRSESLDEMYMTFDTEGQFKNKKISCVLLLKNMIPLNTNVDSIMKDIKGQVEKIGPLVRITHKNQNVYIEYERVEYSQIAYLLISRRKYDGKEIQVSFYDPIKFADNILS